MSLDMAKMNPASRKKRQPRRSLSAMRKQLPWKEQFLLSLIDMILAACLLLSFTGMTLALLGITADVRFVLFAIIISLVAIVGFTLLKWSYKLILISLVPVFIWLRADSFDSIREYLFNWANRVAALLEANSYRGYFPQLSDTEYAAMRTETLYYFVFALVFLLAIVTHLLTTRYKLPTLSVLTLVALVAACSYFDRTYGQIWSIWGFIAVVPLYFLSAAKQVDVEPNQLKRQYLKASLSGLICSSLLLAPAWLLASRYDALSIYSRNAQGIIDDLTTMVPDQFRRPRKFEPFSLNRSGYYPSTSRLGGSVSLNPNPVIRVQGQASSLLKGQTSQTYTGFSWARDPQDSTWRYASGFFTERADEVFDFERDLLDDLGIDESSVLESDYHIDMLQGAITVLFTNGLPRTIELDDDSRMLTFFNKDAVIYTQYPLNVGQGYEITGEAISFSRLMQQIEALYAADDPALEALEAADSNGLFARPAIDAFDEYLQLPSTPEYDVDGSVYQAALSIARGDRAELWNPYPEAQDKLTQLDRLARYLRSMSYSLNVVDVPAGQDFVEHVLEMQIGYCVYYATALSVMARVIGIPSRYVEGFGIPGGQDAVLSSRGLTLTGEQAHAWTEVYIEGLGWIAIDPTPGGVAGGRSDEDPTTTPTQPSISPSIPVQTDPTPPINPNIPNGGNTDSPDGPDDSLFSWPVLLTLIVLVILLSILAASGVLKQIRQRILLSNATWAIRHIGKAKKDKVSGSWVSDSTQSMRDLYLLYWNEVRTELHRSAFASERALRRARRLEARRIRKMGPDYKVPERDFYKPNVQSIYIPSPFVRYLNEQANKRKKEAEARQKEEEARLRAQIYSGPLNRIKTWLDPAILGSWRKELNMAIEHLEPLRSEDYATSDGLLLSDQLIYCERIAEQAAFAAPDFAIEAKDIRKVHHLLKCLSYLRRHWPLPDVRKGP